MHEPGLLQLRDVPTDADLSLLVRRVREQWTSQHGSRVPTQVMRALGWTVRRRRLNHRSASIRSLLVPMLDGGFVIVLNESRRPSTSEAEWLISHEYAHSLFFGPGAPPRRLIPEQDGEEAFCDAFADAMVGSEHRPRIRVKIA